MPTVNFQAPTDYSTELEAIARQRKYAELLQQQGAEGLGRTEVVGGWAIPRSPLEGLSKAFQQGAGAYQQEKLDEKQKDLAKQYQLDLADTLKRAGEAATGKAEMPAQAPTTPMDDEGNAMPGVAAQPAVAPNSDAALQILSNHPATQPGALAEMFKNMSASAAAPQFGLTPPGAAPAVSAPMPSAAAPAGAPDAGSGAAPAPPQPGAQPGAMPPAAEQKLFLPKNIAYQILLHGGPDALAKANAAAWAESMKPTRFNAGGGVVRGDGSVVLSSPQASGVVTDYGPGGPTQRNVPGSLEANAAVTGTQAATKQPFQTGVTKVPVYLPGGDQITVELNPVQMEQFNRSGKLPPEIAASIPGLNSKPPGLPQAPPTVAPTVTPKDIAGIKDPNERAAAQAAYDRQNTRAPIPASAVVGRTQSQSEGITQQRQQAGGKEADQTFAKDYTAFVQGGAQDAAKQLAQLQEVLGQLNKPDANLTGPVLGRTPDVVKSFTNPNAIAMRERVEEVTQRSLRAILGAQFTEKEGERLIARAYNQNLPEAENKVRVQRLFTQLNQAFQAKQSAAKFFEQNGTLQGWQGKLPSISDFDPGAGSAEIDAAIRAGKPATTRAVKWSDLKNGPN